MVNSQMSFDSGRYGAEVASILALDADGARLMPLAAGRCSSEEARRALAATSATRLFGGSFAPFAAMSGLWLYFSCLDESHRLSQDVDSAEGSFWHGIMHRQEPDAGNAGYWFRRVGEHLTFPALSAAAHELLQYHNGATLRLKNKWDPFAFIDFCENARAHPGSPDEQLALAIQSAEWQLLFDHCARAGEIGR